MVREYPETSHTFGMEPIECVCIVCLDSDPPPIQSGVRVPIGHGPGARRVHECKIEGAVSRQPRHGNSRRRGGRAARRSRGRCGRRSRRRGGRACDTSRRKIEKRLAAADTLAQTREGRRAVRPARPKGQRSKKDEGR